MTEEVDHLVPLLTGFGRIFFLNKTFGMFCVLGVSTKNKMGGCEAELIAVFGVFFFGSLGEMRCFLISTPWVRLVFFGGESFGWFPMWEPTGEKTRNFSWLFMILRKSKDSGWFQ